MQIIGKMLTENAAKISFSCIVYGNEKRKNDYAINCFRNREDTKTSLIPEALDAIKSF